MGFPRTAVILAGGKATRLRPLTDAIPKALVDVHGKTITEHLFDLLKKYKIKNVILSVGYLKEKIKEFYGDGKKFDLKIIYIEENEPLGTAGPLRLIDLNETFICMNGDELKNINIKEMFELHKKESAIATLALFEVKDPSAYGVAQLDGNKILKFIEKPKKEEAPSSYINAGFYIFEPEIKKVIGNGFQMLEKDVFPKLAKKGKLFGYRFKGQWFDAGTLERLEIAKKEWHDITFST